MWDGNGNAIDLWGAITGREIATLIQDQGVSAGVAFNQDGNIIASGGDRGVIYLWDAIDGRKIAEIFGHDESVTSVTFSPDGSYLASASRDKSVKLWDMTREGLETRFGLPNLANYFRQGMVSVAKSDVTWDSNHSLFESQVFAGSVSTNAVPTLLTHLGPTAPSQKLFYAAQCGRWRAARSVLNSLQEVTIEDRQVYVTSLLASTRRALNLGFRNEVSDLIVEINKDFSPQVLVDPKVSLPLAEFLFSIPFDDPSKSVARDFEGPLLEVIENTPSDVIEGVIKRWIDHSQGPNISRELSEEIEFWAKQTVSRNSSTVLLKQVRLTLTDSSDPLWISTLRSIRDANDATADDLDAIGVLAAERKFGSEVRDIYDAGIKRFPDQSGWLNYQCGSAIYELGDPKGALVYLEAARTDPDGVARSQLLARLAEVLGDLELFNDAWMVWQEVINLEDSSPEVLADAGYFAAVHDHQDEARSVFDKAFGRASEVVELDHVNRMAGWAFLHLEDPSSALDAFERAKALRNADAGEVLTIDTDLLAGLSLAQWLSSDQDSAIKTYNELVAVGRQAEDPIDWANPQTIIDQGWPEAEAKPFEELRSATLKSHPELAVPVTGTE